MTENINARSSHRRMAVLLSLCAIVIGILAVTVWPTLYRYDHMNLSGNVFPVRTHRLTGKTEMLAVGAGWVELSNKSSSSSKPAPLPGDQLAKLDGRLGLQRMDG